MNFLRRCLIGLTYVLPAVLFFSFYPVVRLGDNSSMNLELSLPLLWLVSFDLIVIIYLILIGWQHRRRPGKKSLNRAKYTRLGFNFPGISDRRIFLLSILPFYTTLSIFWSANPLRALLTAGLIWLVFIAVFALLYLLPLLQLPQHFVRRVLIVFLISSLVICAVCWLQCILDLTGATRDTTLLCRGCTYRAFGFPHPSGFAIEPQFMGNLLLAPTLTALYLVIFARSQLNTKPARVFVWFCAVICSATLFLTFSRGAIYAYAVALVILFCFAWRRSQSQKLGFLVPVVTFLAILGVQGTFAALGPTNDNFVSGTTKAIHHLSLGLIDLRGEAESIESAEEAVMGGEEATFSGYVAESTNVRLSLNQVAFATWHQTPWNLLFGVGLGGAGTAMHEFDAASVTSTKEIVQNEGFNVLLELGVVGITLVGFSMWLLFSPRSGFWRVPLLPLLLSLIVAYLVTLNFFSGLPNALQIYLLPPLLYTLCRLSTAQKVACEKSACKI